MKVEIRKSNIAGNGVFAKEDIKKGEDLCIYDGEYIAYDKINVCKDDMTYALTRPNNFTILGYKEPKSEIGIGQIINDGACPNFEILIFDNVVNELEKYNTETANNMNVALKNDGSTTMVSLKDIKKDEELFYSYGQKYWICNNLINSTNSLLRLMMYILLFPIKTTELDDKKALHIIENVMNQDINNQYWKDVFKNKSPSEFLLIILKQLKV